MPKKKTSSAKNEATIEKPAAPVATKEGEEEEKEVGEREIIVPEVDEAAAAPGEDDDLQPVSTAVEPDEDHEFDDEELFGDEKDQW